MSIRTLAVCGALLALCSAAEPQGVSHAQAESPQSILSSLPPPTHGDCLGPDGRKHDQALQAFGQRVEALDRREKAALEAITAEMQKAAAADPMALVQRDPRQTVALNQWMTAPGHVEEPSLGETLFGKPTEAARASERPIAARGESCAQREGCDPAPIYRERAPIRTALASSIEKAWPQFVSTVQKNLAWDTRPLPPGVDAKALPVRMQLASKQGQLVADLGAAGDVARRYGCVQTQGLESPAK